MHSSDAQMQICINFFVSDFTLAFFCPTMAPEFIWSEVVIEANAMSSNTPGPIGLKFLGSPKGSKDSSG